MNFIWNWRYSPGAVLWTFPGLGVEKSVRRAIGLRIGRAFIGLVVTDR